jgi:hypothetical protein
VVRSLIREVHFDQGKFSLGLAPVFYIDNGSDIGLYTAMGIGISRQVDFSVKACFHDNPVYVGGDVEVMILSGFPTISIAMGMHKYNKLGIDGTFNLTFPIRHVASLYGGIDVDVEFNDKTTTVPLWGFVGLEVVVRKHLGLIVEIDPAINIPAWNMFLLGLAVYF